MKYLIAMISVAMLLPTVQAAEQNLPAKQGAQDRYLELQERLSERLTAMLAERVIAGHCDAGKIAAGGSKQSPACRQAGHDQLLAADKRG